MKIATQAELDSLKESTKITGTLEHLRANFQLLVDASKMTSSAFDKFCYEFLKKEGKS